MSVNSNGVSGFTLWPVKRLRVASSSLANAMNTTLLSAMSISSRSAMARSSAGVRSAALQALNDVLSLAHHLLDGLGYALPSPSDRAVARQAERESCAHASTRHVDPEHRRVLALCHRDLFDNAGCLVGGRTDENHHEVAASDLRLNGLLPCSLRQSGL